MATLFNGPVIVQQSKVRFRYMAIQDFMQGFQFIINLESPGNREVIKLTQKLRYVIRPCTGFYKPG